MSVFLEGLVLILTAMTLGATVVGLGVKFALLPWLEKHLIRPAKVAANNAAETRRQVTVNNNISDPPTLLDTVHNLKGEAHKLRLEVEDARAAFHLAARMFEGHVNASEADRADLRAALEALQKATPPS